MYLEKVSHDIELENRRPRAGCVAGGYCLGTGVAKRTLAPVPGASYDALTGFRGDLDAIVMGVAFIVVALILPSRPLGKPLGKHESGLATAAE